MLLVVEDDEAVGTILMLTVLEIGSDGDFNSVAVRLRKFWDHLTVTTMSPWLAEKEMMSLVETGILVGEEVFD